jgi:hypothetical protein
MRGMEEIQVAGNFEVPVPQAIRVVSQDGLGELEQLGDGAPVAAGARNL